MTKERLKTLLLLSMVLLSFVLTKHLWITMPNDLFSFQRGGQVVGASYLLEDMIKPYKYLINFSSEAHTFQYIDNDNNLWTSARSILANVLSSNSVKSKAISNEDFLKSNERRSIVFYFPENFSTFIISRSLNIAKPNYIVEKMPEINSIYFYLGQDEPFIIFSHGKKHLKVHGIDMDLENLQKLIKTIEETENFTYYYPMKNTLGIDSNLFISYNMTDKMAEVYVENELNTSNIGRVRSIAESFFNKSIDYIGEIVEDNGSIIYLYNQEVLKISPSGQLEYFSPLDEEVLERNLYMSLNTAAEFLAKNMEVPENIYLAKIEEIEAENSLGYRLSFRYKIRGYPLIMASNTMEDPIEIDVFNKNIRTYKRFIRKDMEIVTENPNKKDKLLSSFDIINKDMNYRLLENYYMAKHKTNLNKDYIDLNQEVLSSIKSINIVYVDLCTGNKGEKLIEAWLVELEDKLYAFDIYNSKLILEKDINQ